MNNMKMSDTGLTLLKNFESCKLTAYLDSVKVPTIGYGHTKGVQLGQTITQEQADQMLINEMSEYEGYVNNLVKVELNQNQFDALCDFVYNEGPKNLSISSLLRYVNNNDFTNAALEFPKWDRAGGVELNGLLRRRKAEQALFTGNDWTVYKDHL